MAQRRVALKKNRRSTVDRIERQIERLWLGLVGPAWELCWNVIDNELRWPEAPSVARRWQEDRLAYTEHIDWERSVGRRRLRQTPLQAARTLSMLEKAHSRLEVEEATDDPVRMIPYALTGEALIGTVVRVDATNRDRSATGRNGTYPLVTIECAHDCPMPVGKELYWAAQPSGSGWIVLRVDEIAPQRSIVTLRRATAFRSTSPLPSDGTVTSFSRLHFEDVPVQFPHREAVPWTHRTVVDADHGSIDDSTTPPDELTAVLSNPRDREADE